MCSGPARLLILSRIAYCTPLELTPVYVRPVW
jgi:hypothetical protein